LSSLTNENGFLKPNNYMEMQLVTQEDFIKYAKVHRYVVIEDQKVAIGNEWNITRYAPENYSYEKETIWSFPQRGDWATHIGNYRGNWSPFIPRNLIMRFTSPRDIVLDQMVGSGTTLVECKLLGRQGIGVDINPDAIMVTRDRLNFVYKLLSEDRTDPPITYIGDARKLDKVKDESVDLVVTHPPYAYIINYSQNKINGDLSALTEIEDYLFEMRKIANECMRVLEPGKHCGILIGDTRKHKHYVLISTRVMQEFLNAGFILREDIIKQQWKTKTTREKWSSDSLDFYRIAHEHLYIFRKPLNPEELKELKLSIKW